MSKDLNFDVTVIGGGPGGYVAAIKAAQLGFRVTVIEKEHMGGICLNWGCIPTKALLHISEVWRSIKEANSLGINVNKASFDVASMVQYSRNVVGKLSGGIDMLMKKHNIKVISGSGKIVSPHKVTVIDNKNGNDCAVVSSKYIICATGARARTLPGFEVDGKFTWSYREAMMPQAIPETLVVIGSGAIGMEFASFYNALGSKVHILEASTRILLSEDQEIAELALQAFQGQGMSVHTGVKLTSLEKTKVCFNDAAGKKSSIDASKLLVAIGVVPNIENMGLEDNKILLEKGAISVNEHCQTSAPNIFAIGDCTYNNIKLAHKASREGIIAAEKIAAMEGKSSSYNTSVNSKNNIPGCIYTYPQIASVGISEAQAKDAGMSYRVGRSYAHGNGKAIASGEKIGMVKTIFDKRSGELLGAHMIGSSVTEMIQGFVIGKQCEMTEFDFANTIFPHPTMSEMMYESTLDALEMGLHG